MLKRHLTRYHKNFLELQELDKINEEDYYQIFGELLKSHFKEEEGINLLINQTDTWSHNVDQDIIDKPDFLITKKKIPILRIEAKNPGYNIDNGLKASCKERLFNQIYRYRGRKNGNQPVAITDFKKIWIINKDSENDINKDHEAFQIIKIIDETNSLNINAHLEILKAFDYLTSDVVISIDNIQNLIEPLAEYAKKLHDEILNLISTNFIANESEQIKINLIDLSKDLKNTIFKDSEIDGKDQFSDFFAQTIIYSCFLGWLRFCKEGNEPKNFKISHVAEFLPKETFIQKIFIDLKSLLTERLYNEFLLEIEQLLSGTEFKIIIRDIDVLMATFYSDFLHLYDEVKAKNLGVVFTPTEIVDFMVDGIDKILIKYFKKLDGIISPGIKFLDPASGTMSYTCSLIRKAFDKFEYINRDEEKLLLNFENWIKNQFYENFYAFEILMAPFVLGYLKTMITIEDLGVNLDWGNYKIKSYLMNTLMDIPHESLKFFLKNEEIKEDIMQALYTRQQRDIMIVLGNPPYNISSQNRSRWIEDKLEIYKSGLTERNLKILSDDYVKFIRFSQWRIAETSKMGIIALITNNKYFYGDIFRKMRKSLKKDFDIIYTINLHGDLRKGESGNPFDIKVGVGIIFLVRLPHHSDKNCEVYSWDIPDNSKYVKFNILNEGFKFEKFKIIKNDKYFVEIDSNLEIEEEFNSYPSLTNLFINKPQSGIMSGRDHLVYSISKPELFENYNLFFNQKFEQLENKKIKIKDTKNWKINNALKKFSQEPPNIIKVNYRGFDSRYLLYDDRLVEGHRKGYIDQISENNPAISTTKSVRKGSFSHCLITRYAVEKCFVSVNDTSYVFPLRFNSQYNLRIPSEIAFNIVEEDLFYYIYAILYSNTYRKRYASQLLRNYPHIPLFKDRNIFEELSKIGHKLAKKHLFIDADLNTYQFDISTSKNLKIYEDFHYEENEKKFFFGSDP